MTHILYDRKMRNMHIIDVNKFNEFLDGTNQQWPGVEILCLNCSLWLMKYYVHKSRSLL
jgi:hypothetical protein